MVEDLPDALVKQRLSEILTTANGNEIVRSYVRRINSIKLVT
jgi:hypothetical protein